MNRLSNVLYAHLHAKLSNDRGMSTIEYAFGSLAAAALAGVLYMVVNGNGVTSAIERVITDALSNTPG
ncbi:DUF4244 domain-containing protein [Corynebacterium liangguodongii]|uniref:DUF4244 domain-containing protein n=1 Tax=Corynebacterium liangguodongii TaxID=2079535 RepID=A0A2S0WBU9_9CORY|nr:DUF4244 domain-containing protein [Corynebacterium liangguodongii]AWB83230.1 DUF4244 domain-containing protein [Corynebacterium liangguodongii]PWB98673.1 DUF4244 domain-containing protein [Corynebacterium liangguodongii]